MGFWHNYDIEKQHINLSQYAMSIIEDDQLTFGVKNFSTFINRVFGNFYPHADASVILRTECERKRLKQGVFGEIDTSEDIKNTFIESCVSDMEKEIRRQIELYPKGIGRKIRINNENYRHLKSESKEDIFYGEHKVGCYIKAVVEEYARKPYIDRERIYFGDFIDIIDAAIKENHQITLKSGTVQYSVSAFSVMSDKQNNYNYLVGRSSVLNFNGSTEPIDCSFRLSRIKDIRISKTQESVFVSDEVRKEFAKTLNSRSAQFMGGNDSESVTIRLTFNGMKMYDKMQHLRPDYTEMYIEKKDFNGRAIYNYILKFDCTTQQIDFYFFKFGKDAEILSPSRLAADFKHRYLEAYRIYE